MGRCGPDQHPLIERCHGDPLAKIMSMANIPLGTLASLLDLDRRDCATQLCRRSGHASLTLAFKLAFWTFDAVFDIVSRLVILVLPIVIVQPLLMPAGRKLQAVSAFTSQLPACAFAVIRLLYLHQAHKADDYTWAAVEWQKWTAINMHFNVVAANIPCLKVFLVGQSNNNRCLYLSDDD